MMFVPSYSDITIENVVILQDTSEHMGYVIEIHTSRGVISITGNHDMGPELNCDNEIMKHHD